MRKYWFYFFPHTFAWQNRKEFLIYNSAKGRGFVQNNTETLFELIRKLLNPSNMYCIQIGEEILKNAEINSFIKHIIKSSSGKLIESTSNVGKPVIMYPEVSIQRGVKNLNKQSKYILDDNVISYLQEISLHLSGTNKCGSFNKHKQFQYISDVNMALTNEDVSKILSELNSLPIYLLNLIGLNCKNYSYYKPILNELIKTKFDKNIYMTLNDLEGEFNHPLLLESENFNKIIIIENFDQNNINDTIIRQLLNHNSEIHFNFVVESHSELKKAISFISSLKLVNSIIRPYYNGNNIDLFKENVFIEAYDLLNKGIKKNEIFIHQAINIFDFGKLIILPNRKVYSNVNFPAIGTIEDNIKDLLYKELFFGKAWRRIRNMKPCRNCIYKWLCPSPSNYEIVIGKSNLCHVFT